MSENARAFPIDAAGGGENNAGANRRTEREYVCVHRAVAARRSLRLIRLISLVVPTGHFGVAFKGRKGLA